jgi:hypothetical protein
MGQLTNLFVSESYQGLLKLEDSTTGVTGNLQYVTDGLGNRIPMLASTSSIVITGSFRGDGSGLTGITANFDSSSLVTTASFNAFTSSIDARVDALELETGSLENLINQKLDTGSFNTYTSSNDAKVNSLINATGSYATTSSLTALSQSVAVTDLAQNNRLGSLETATGSLQNQINQKLDSGSFNTYTSSNDTKVNDLISKTGSYATTGSNVFNGTQTISGSLNVTGEITALSASITYLETIYQTSSVLFSSGSNILGDEAGDTQTLWGTVNLPSGPLVVTGSVYSSDIIGTGSLFLKPNQADARFVEIYNTSPTDIHITSSGGQIFLGDDITYVKVDNYGSVNRIDIVADNELVVSSSIVNVTGSLHQSGTFYPDIIDWFSSSIVQSTGSYILTTDISGVTQYDSYQNVASELQQYINTGSLPSGTVSGSAQIVELGFATTGSVDALTGSINSLNAATSSYVTETESGSFMVTGSVSGATSTFTKGDGSTFNLTVNNVQSASQAQNANTASFALNGGVTQILAGPNIIVSPLSGQGQVTISSTGTGTGSFNTATGSYGSFYDTTIQTNPVVNTPNSMSFNETAITNGVSISGSISPFNTYIKTENAGVYNIQFSAQVEKTDSGTDEIDIWIRKNGIDLEDTATKLTLSGNNTKAVAAWNWFVPSAANDYYQLIWSSDDTGMRLFAEPSSSVHPGIPSVIATANRIDQFLSNTGSFNGDFNGSFTGSLQGTASFATNALSASWAPMPDVSYFATTGSNRFNGNQIITGSVIMSGSAGIELEVIGDQTITGSLSISGRSNINGPLSSTDGLIKIFTTASFGNPSVQPGQFITASAPISQSNIVFAGTQGIDGQGPLAVFSTGSIVISGSNNILFTSVRNNLPLGSIGYVNSNNIATTYPSLNTSSLYRPSVSNNLLYGGLTMTMGSGSGQFNINNNLLYGGLNLNVPSASIGGTYANNVIAGTVTVQQPVAVTGSVGHNVQQNIINGTLGIQINSGSLQLANNSINGVAQITGSYLSTGATANNLVLFNSNTINGLNHRFIFGGVGNGTKNFRDNLIGGALFTGSIVANNQEGIQSFMAFGRGLYAEGGLPGGADTAGSTFLGRWNETGSLSNPGQYRFVIGNGTDAANRRTSLALDGATNTFIFNSNINQTGSLNISGSATITGSVQGNVQPLTVASATASLNLNNGNFFELALTGSQNIFINPSNIKPGQTVNIKLNTTGSGTVSFPTSVKQVSGSAYVPSTGTTTDIITLVSFDSSNLFLANVKNLI